jgi:hypothetical protein
MSVDGKQSQRVLPWFEVLERISSAPKRDGFASSGLIWPVFIVTKRAVHRDSASLVGVGGPLSTARTDQTKRRQANSLGTILDETEEVARRY